MRARDLAMTQPEAGVLLHRHGVRVTDLELNVLTARTEGWVAGLRLSAISMERQAPG